MPEGWGKVKVASKYAGVSERTFRDWLKQGLKHSRLPSGTVLIRYSDIDGFLSTFGESMNQTERIVEDLFEEIGGVKR